MAIVLGGNQYGKAEIRLVRVVRDDPTHELRDLNVSVALSGDLTASHYTGDNAKVLPTDSQKNTVYAFAEQYGIGEIESFALRLGRHFVDSQPSISRARVSVQEYGWRRLGPHSFQRSGAETRTVTVTVEQGSDGSAGGVWVVSGLTDLVLLNTTASEFTGYVKDAYTTLPEATDRVLATAVTAGWRHAGTDSDWAASYAGAREALVEAFANTYSHALQQTLYAMGSVLLARRPELVEVRLSLPNRHHFLVDLSPFGLDNPGEVFHADDRPYGLIEGTVLRDDAAPAGPAWAAPWSS
ncbi:MAG TPA: urate oxidase [Micromonosporaceae bacterium]|nr:urate oxidase [Micromonosporaceae bacterium]